MIRVLLSAALVVAAVSLTPALVQAAEPLMDQVCAPPDSHGVRLVDKQLLADFYLDQAGVRRAVERAAPAGPAVMAPLTTAQRLLVVDKPCVDNPVCSKTDIDKVDQARGAYKYFVQHHSGTSYRPIGAIDNSIRYFLDPDLQFQCLVDPVPPKPNKLDLPIVIRGDGDSLFIDRATESALFKAASKATISTSSDGVKHKQTVKVVGVVGVPIVLKGKDEEEELYPLIPYVGINKNFSKVRGAARSITADTWNVGLAARFELPRLGEGTQWLGVRPDYLWNDADGSRLATLNFNWRPIFGAKGARIFGINSFSQPWGKANRQTPWVQPIFEVHASKGWYDALGDSPPPGRTNYFRIGPKTGVVLASGDPNVPWTLTLSNVHLWGDKGSPRDIDYNTAILSLPLDPDQYLAVDLTYSNGRREDTGLREQAWGVSLGARY